MVGLQIGNTAPEIEGIDTTGKTVKLGDFRGNVVVVQFWRTNFAVSDTMIANDKDWLKKFEAKPFIIIGICVDEYIEDLTQCMRKEQITWPNIFDGNAGPNKKRWQTYNYPTQYVVDAKGIIRGAEIKYAGEVEALIEKLLKEMEANQPR